MNIGVDRFNTVIRTDDIILVKDKEERNTFNIDEDTIFNVLGITSEEEVSKKMALIKYYEITEIEKGTYQFKLSANFMKDMVYTISRESEELAKLLFKAQTEILQSELEKQYLQRHLFQLETKLLAKEVID